MLSVTLASMNAPTSTLTIDCDFHFPQFAASYLIVDEGEAAFIDNNTSQCVPLLLETLHGQGLTNTDVKYVIITHVHLDHAGGTSQLMEACPDAILLAHPKAARHMIDPSRLIAGVRAVYGDEVYDEVYGEIGAINANRVQAVADYDTVTLGSRRLEFIHTRGHANHHMCIFDQATGDIFTGDAFGVAYPVLQNGQLFIYPTSSPTEFDGQLAIEAIEKIVAKEPNRACLTHYGAVSDVARAAEILKTDLQEFERIVSTARALASEAEIQQFCTEQMRLFFMRKLSEVGKHLTPELEDFLAIDITLNADGLAHQAVLRNSKSVKL